MIFQKETAESVRECFVHFFHLSVLDIKKVAI